MIVAASEAQAGPLGLGVIVVLIIAVVFLARSLMKHLDRVPASFDKPREDDKRQRDDDQPRG